MEHLIEVKNLHTEFRQSKGILKAVNGVSYYLDPGEIVAFVGESGSGKSVTQYSGVQLIASPPGRITEGEILFEGQNLLSYGPNSEELRKVRGGKIGIVFQEPMTSLNPVMTIGNQLTESVMLHLHMTKAQARERAVELLKKVGIPDPESRLNAYPHQFSGGMRQRIVIAMALSCNPKLLIADEATTALDVTTQAQILDLMQDIVKESNTAMVLVTHNLSIVARYAQRVYVMYAGEIVEHGTTEEIFKNPHHPYTIGLMNAVPGLNDQKDRKLIPITGFVTNLVNRKDECAFMNRCPYATKECASGATPRLKAVPGEDDHFAACHRTITKETKVEKIFDVADRTYTAKAYDKMTEADKILKVEDLKVYFPVYKGLMRRKIADVKAVDGITFDIYKGETFGLVGESGCGKSTVARTILRLNDSTGGKITFNGVDITHLDDVKMREHRRNMSMIFQDPYGSLDPRQRAGDIVKEPMKNFRIGLSEAEMDKRVDELFALVGLDPAYRERVPHEFSGGQRQRLVIARAISTNPSFIVCDEAISALDVSIQAQVINLLEELQQKLGLTYLFIAHDLSVVRHISDRVAVMYLGQMVEFADWDSLYSNPLHPYTRSLLEAVPVPDPFTEKTRERQIVQGEVPSPMQRPAGCAFSTRCPYATDRCRTQMPLLKDQGDGHKVACHLMEK
ncbi:MAG: ABC transporter ATP-binding protein [Lachnospiraceae bacterium]|jgi:peptide/nickel transport system ATP-binding protein|nr:ABC transporter ATP-binding protein [Lachnospiraceae bacterium]MCI9013184.1 ABC transporter ATP-binding protein [Lachnospiraceae bacterium]